jgi:Ca2+-transporting ATPase
MIEAAIALAVAAIPEGLPIVATLALARGMWRMARQNALVKRLSAVETLGATTVILTDKTGTLTENRMAVRRLTTPAHDVDLSSPPFAADSDAAPDNPEVRDLLRVAALCNDADLERADDAGTGDPMEIALLRAAYGAGFARRALLREWPLVHEHAFDSGLRMMATVHEHGGTFLYAVKGAPEAVAAAVTHVITGTNVSPLDDAARDRWLSRAEDMARGGLRVLACAMKTATGPDASPFAGLTLVGFIGLEDPPRAEVPRAIRDCHAAGIRVVMVTGDHAHTARGIGRAVGLVGDKAHVVEGNGVAAAIAGGAAGLRSIDIFARVSPAEKLALVKAWQAAGDVVAMTGDGVNDGPALHQADIGIAMGLRGTDVAREAAAVVLLDDAFPTIVGAIREGRIIFANIRRFVAYLLSCNFSEVMVVGLAVLSALPLPLLPLQILYLNLVTDVFPAFALAMGEGEAGILSRPPRDPKEPILGYGQWIAILLHGVALTAGTFAALACARLLAVDESHTVTVTFLTLAFAQL